MAEFGEKHSHPTRASVINQSISPDQKRNLHQLAINAVIEDGRSFNDLNKPGITKLLNGLLEGTKLVSRLAIYIRYLKVFVRHTEIQCNAI